MTPSVQLAPERHWLRPGIVFLLLLGWTLFWFRDTASAIVRIWLQSDTFTHGFLVVPIVLWLVWRKRATLAPLQPRPNAWAVVLLALVAFAWLLGDLVAVNALTQLAFVAMLVLLVPAIFGLAVTQAIAFPLAFMFFAVPIGAFAMPQLMSWTADFTIMALRWSGIPVYREGLQFVIPSGNWSVVEACSGVRYLIASVTVGTLFAYLNYQSTQRRVLFILVAIIVPVIANWLRAYMIVMLGHYSGNTLATGVDHLIYGWLFFGVVILLMFLIGARWSEPEPSVSAADIDSVTLQKSHLHQQPAARPRFELAAILVALLVAAPPLGRAALDTANNAATPQLAAPTMLSPAWWLAPDPVAVFKPAFNNPSAEFNASYATAESKVGLYLGYYRQQDYSRKLVSSQNVLVLFKDPLWAHVASSTADISINGAPVKLRTAELRQSAAGMSDTMRLTVWQIYWVNGKLTSSDILAKAYGAFYRLLGRGDDAAVIVLYTPKGAGDEGKVHLRAFLQDNAAAITALLAQTRQATLTD
ncbi:MAG: exosortase A [Comamonadaceae bacterium CG_4_9_14_3_um_filter_60_33]|nr:MAG: exosortase A [Comamonadaceae bacterium CG2_30_59_20]PIY28331.1 MAG: exosortase A [Comamonadaceae bacterium CG_4_10_14_3_um_filter_60_42]PJB42561.1 MAG: exosortase A [Comamonadaceae bacterium CG_4_9_14_3_um_filter_60_33]